MWRQVLNPAAGTSVALSFPSRSHCWWQFAWCTPLLITCPSWGSVFFHRDTHINSSEVVWTNREGQSWDNDSYLTDVQMLPLPDEFVTNSVWWKYLASFLCLPAYSVIPDGKYKNSMKNCLLIFTLWKCSVSPIQTLQDVPTFQF